MFLIFSPNHDFFKKVAHDNSESFAPILNWGWLIPGRFVTKNHFEERVILGPFLTILTFFQRRTVYADGLYWETLKSIQNDTTSSMQL